MSHNEGPKKAVKKKAFKKKAQSLSPKTEEILSEVEGVPTWLETPVTDVPPVKPPVDTRAQLLPLNALTWEHFERLCLRFVRTQAFVVRTTLYGVKGQKQHGIDLLARLSDLCDATQNRNRPRRPALRPTTRSSRPLNRATPLATDTTEAIANYQDADEF